MRKSKKSKNRPPREGCAIGAANREERRRQAAREAIWHLRLIVEGSHIPELYRKFFPQEFARARCDYSSAPAILGYYDRFASLVDRRLFPVWDFSSHGWAYDDPGAALNVMGIVLIDNWLWYKRGESGEELHVVEKMVAQACDKDILFPELDLRMPAGHTFNWESLNLACEEEKGHIRRLGLVARAIVGGTGNVWLDISEEEYGMAEMPEWTEDQINFLADTYAEAKRMKKEIAEFFRWADSPGKVERVKRILRGCWLPEGQRVRVRARPAPTLVEALGGLL